jgi:hypothetical protein
MKFSDIKKFTQDGYYHTDIVFTDVKHSIERYIKEYGLILNPDFQRGHVWTKNQQIAFVEYILKGGITSDIRLNHPGWMNSFKGKFVCVDGLQRLSAIVAFLNNEIPAFDILYKDFEGNTAVSISIRINNLKTRKEVLQWYIDLNTGGTIHTKEEIEKVKNLLKTA